MMEEDINILCCYDERGRLLINFIYFSILFLLFVLCSPSLISIEGARC